MDRIEIRRLEVFAHHGCLPQENELGQNFYVSARLYPQGGYLTGSDRLEDSLDYSEVCRDIRTWMTRKTYHLIETCAVRIAEKLLTKYSALESVEIEVEKPAAPMPHSFQTVLARAERSWHRVFLGLGSNMGDRQAYLAGALKMLEETPSIRLIQISGIYETEPYGVKEQAPFLNACLELKTWLPPQALLAQLHRIEAALGRERSLRWGPRTIDLDILFYDHEVIDRKDLQIPHIDMANRLFVLRPLAQIAGSFRHPLLQITVEEMLQALLDKETES